MITSAKYVTAIALILAIGSPSFADEVMPAARAAAIHDCNKKAAKYSMSAAQTEQLEVYRACMAADGQME
jgi:hypothetical protein